MKMHQCSVQPIAINKELQNCETTVLFRLVLGKEKLTTLITSSELYLDFFKINLQNKG